MNKQDRLMDYLYGEMNEAERKAFEAELASDSSLQKELEAMRQTRHMLAELPDVKPAARLLSISNEATAWRRWGPRAGVAAAVLLLLLVFNARLEWTGQGLILALGAPAIEKPSAEPALAADDMLNALEVMLDRREQEMQARLQSLDSTWQEQRRAGEATLRREWRNDHREQLAQWEQAVQPELMTLIQQGQLEQQRELRLLLTEFYAEWQQTRQTDLQSIEQQFVDLYQKVAFNQQEMDAMLNELGRVGD